MRGKPNLQWLKFTMVTTEMVSSADNTARGFLPVTGGGLAAGQDASSINVLREKNVSSFHIIVFHSTKLTFTVHQPIFTIINEETLIFITYLHFK